MITASEGLIRVRACQIKLFDSKGKQYLYRFGDPEGDRDITVAVSMEADYQDIQVDELLDSAKIFKTGQRYTFRIDP